MLTGCESVDNPFASDGAIGGALNRDKPKVTAPDPIEERLADAADRAAEALQELAEVEQMRTPLPAVSSVAGAPEELMRTVTVDWIGPIAPIAKRLAERAGYSFTSLGDPPPLPIIVTLNATETPVVELLRDAGLQAGGRADISVNAANRVVELRYAPVDPNRP